MVQNLKAYSHQEFDLEGLAGAVRALIERAELPSADGRVAEFPDGRTIRYYQTLGLVSKPTRYDGRNAVYSYQHLLQVVAVKLLQARGMSLSQVQAALARATPALLEQELGSALGPGIARPTASAPEMTAHFEVAFEPQVVHALAPSPSRELMAVEVAPGITVLIDPTVAPDVTEILARIAGALKA
jgi:DNA-binding transcriptional MerR regulator